ncbi:MAG TPA: two-component regulator propeller domain-containing protein, partial [Chitinophagaceae bacterium]|nr:two-component regulator propeller domain-containing protein [Chitinophagaceae bacterium]
YITALLSLLFAAAGYPTAATDNYKAFNYQRTNGLPGNKVYCIYQDTRDYIWMGTENGLVSFNGHEFRTYTVKDGLPDNEVLSINEDRSGKLWLTTFSNEICYLWKGKLFNSDNAPLLRKLKLSSLPKSVVFDRWGNAWIPESGAITCIHPNGLVSKITGIGKDKFPPIVPLRINSRHKAVIVNETKFYEYTGNRFELVAEVPIHPSYHYSHNKFLELTLEEFSWTPLPVFITHYKSDANLYYRPKALTSINFLKKLSEDLLCIGSKDGAWLKAIRNGKEVARFLEGRNVSCCLMARDGSLWFGTLGAGVFHYFPSFIKSIPLTGKSRSVSFIKAGKQELHLIAEGHSLIQVGINDRLPETIAHINDNKAFYTYVECDRSHNWIICAADSISKYTRPGGRLLGQYNISYCKSVFEEGDSALLIGTLTGIFRIDKDRFRITDTFYNNRVTAVARVAKTIYAGTLQGLLRFDQDKKIMVPFGGGPVLSGHITALCADGDSVLWVANNKAAVIRIGNNNRIQTIIDRSTGLEFNSIATIKARGRYLWVGTDNGLY